MIIFEKLIYSFLAFAPFFLIFLIKKRSRQNDLLSPYVIFAGLLFIGTSLRTLYILFDGNADGLKSLLGPYSYEDILYLGLIGINIGVLSFMSGYYSMSSGRQVTTTNSLAPKFIKKNTYSIVFTVFFLIGVTLIFFYLNAISFITDLSDKGISTKRFIGDNRTVFGFLSIGSNIIAVLTIVHALYYYNVKRTKVNRLILIFLFFLAILIPIIARTRVDIVYLLLSILVIKHYSYKKIKLKYLLGFIFISFTILSILGSIVKVKDEDTTINFNFSSIIENIVYAPHFLGVGKTSVIIATIPEKESFHFGKSYLSILFAPIPRPMWPEKPVIRVGRFVGQNLYEKGNFTGVPPGIVGESYLNFGWAGIFIIPFLLGALIKKIYNKIIKTNHIDMIQLGFYSIFIIFSIEIITTDFTGAVIRFLSLYIPYIIIIRFSFKRLPYA